MDNKFKVIRAEVPEEHSPKVADLYLDPNDDEVFIVFSRVPGVRAKTEYVAISITSADTYNGWCSTLEAAVDGLEFLGDDCEVTVKSPLPLTAEWRR